jgi:hypothetical protein
MGIRIHKMIGWGLSDLVEQADSRINYENLFVAKDINKFIEWLKEENQEAIDVLLKIDQVYSHRKDMKGNLDDCQNKISWIIRLCEDSESDWNMRLPISYDPEFCSPNFLVFLPIDMNECSRYDNLIDYYDCKAGVDIKDLTHRCGIYPWIGMQHIPGSPHYGKNDKNYPYIMDGGRAVLRKIIKF